MIVKTKTELSEAVSAAVAKLWGENVIPEFSVPDDFNFGDISTNLPFKLAKSLRKPPKAIAEELASLIELPDGICSAEPTGGYINFRYDNSFLYDLLASIISHPSEFGRGARRKSGKIQIEYVSANPTGPLNIVSARAAAVGSSIVEIMRHAGYEVSGEYYINDGGNQIRMLEKSFIERIRQGAGLEWSIPRRGRLPWGIPRRSRSSLRRQMPG